MANTFAEYKIRFVISHDDTKIAYRQLGTGPGVILVHGALMTAEGFMQLGTYLSDTFTVYIPDRQGRVQSEAHATAGLQAESEDIEALIKATGAENIFGLSSGAIITLHAVLATNTIKRMALYEPPISMAKDMHAKWYEKYQSAMASNNYGKAFIQLMKGTKSSPMLAALPAFITVPIFNLMLKMRGDVAEKNAMSFKELIASFPYDRAVVSQSAGIIEKIKGLDIDVLLLGGTKSPAYLKQVLETLQAALPKAKKTMLSGQRHIAAANAGKPEIIAKELLAFFK